MSRQRKNTKADDVFSPEEVPVLDRKYRNASAHRSEAEQKKFNEVFDQKSREASALWNESEQKRLNEIFATLGSVGPHATLSRRSFSQPCEFSTLDKVRSCVEQGDRKAMVELLMITTDTLRVFEVLPTDVRAALADGLEKMRISLEESKQFLPKKRGQKPANFQEEYRTAMQVEFYRYFSGMSLEDARAKVEADSGLKDDLIHKRWKRHHESANSFLETMTQCLEVVSRVTGIPNTIQPAEKHRAKKRK